MCFVTVTSVCQVNVFCKLFAYLVVEVEVLGIRLEVEDEPSASCLLSGSNVTLTCDIVGYPRPQIIFSRASIEIDPSMDTRIADASFDQVQMCALPPTWLVSTWGVSYLVIVIVVVVTLLRRSLLATLWLEMMLFTVAKLD